MSWRLDCKRPAMWPKCKPNRSLSFKAKPSELNRIRQREEVLDQHLSREQMCPVPTAPWTPGYWVVLIISRVFLEHGETGAPSSERMPQLASHSWSS